MKTMLFSAAPPTPIPDSSLGAIEVKPALQAVAQSADYIYLGQGCPQGRDVQHWLEAEAQMMSSLIQKSGAP
jgi:hypothetical protein